MSDFEKLLDKRIAKAIFRYNMIENGDRILVAVSGGKDSLSMVYHLNKKFQNFSINFHMEAIHVKSDFTDPANVDQMTTVLKEWGIPLTVIDVPVLDRLKPGKKMNCYWCSTQRRMELMKYAEENSFNKIALGHHMDDILETFFMNMTQKGELSTMLPVMKYDRNPNIIIRPLACIKEEEIIAFAQEKGFHQFACQCGYDDTSRRKTVRKFIDHIIDNEGEFVRENIFKALHNPSDRYLIKTAAR